MFISTNPRKLRPKVVVRGFVNRRELEMKRKTMEQLSKKKITFL